MSRLKYFRTSVGMLKLTSLIFVMVVVALCFYNHFNSHWTFHSNLLFPQIHSTRPQSQSFYNDYENCIEVDFNFRTQIGTSGVTCPNPMCEVFLLFIATVIFLVSLVLLSMIYFQLGKTDDIKDTLRFDFVLHLIAFVFLLLGSCLYIYSTYQITVYCAVKAEFEAPTKPTQTNSNPDIIKTNITPAPQTITISKQRVAVLLGRSNSDPAKVIIDRSGDADDESDAIVSPLSEDANVLSVSDTVEDHLRMERHKHIGRVCNLQVLTVEKYFTAVVALITALLQGALVLLLMPRSIRRVGHGENAYDEDEDDLGPTRQSSDQRSLHRGPQAKPENIHRSNLRGHEQAKPEDYQDHDHHHHAAAHPHAEIHHHHHTQTQ